jgi:hypothetical protein
MVHLQLARLKIGLYRASADLADDAAVNAQYLLFAQWARPVKLFCDTLDHKL